MTPLPPRRRQHPLNLDGVWLIAASANGTKEVPGMSVVADPRGFTIAGPDPGTERTIPWEQTTGFTCQRPARLPDGSPATVLEVGLANGRVLELLLPVTRVPPSETVVVETELAVMAEQYGGGNAAPARPDPVPPPIAVAPETPIAPSSVAPSPPAPAAPAPAAFSPAAGSNGSGSNGLGSSSSGSNGSGSPAPAQEIRRGQDESTGALSEASGVDAPEQTAPLTPRGSHTNGSSAPGPTRLAVDSPAAPAPASSAVSTSVSDRRPEAAATPKTVATAKPAVAEPALDAVRTAFDPAPPAASPVVEPKKPPPASEAADPTTEAAVSPETAAPPEADVSEPETAALPEPDVAAPETADSPDAQLAGIERREHRLFTLLVALIGVVVLVLIAELVLILFVLNHNPNPKSPPVHSQTTAIAHVRYATTLNL